jgi:cytochrome P450
MLMFPDPDVIDDVVELPREVGDVGAARRRIVPVVSERSVLGADQDEHRVIRERLEPTLDAGTLARRRDAMTRIADEHVEPAGCPFRVRPRMRLIADRAAASAAGSLARRAAPSRSSVAST